MGVSQTAERTASKKRSPKGGIPLSAAMILVTLGVVYGDIGTSPMYTLKAIMSGNGGLTTMSQDVVIGALSLIIWTMTLITTVKYVLVAMKADNHNEGGIFALYSLVKRCGKWLIIPAMIGGAALLADGILTPAVTVTTAIEGLRTIDFFHAIIGDNQGIVVLITIVILCALFAMQRAGTSTIGKAFGPIMTVWFLYLGITGLVNIGADANVYSNAVARIKQTRGLADDARASLLVLLFIAAGATWDAGEAARITFEFMEAALGAPDTTPEPKLLGTGRAVKERASEKGLALLRVENGYAKPPLHVLSSEETGTVIGFMPGPDDPCAITDVDRDVSRRHARIRLVDGRWLLEDLDSTNGTRILPGVAPGDGKKRSFIQVEPGRPVEITNADQIVLGATTRFLAIRVVE